MIFVNNILHHFVVVCETFYLNKVSWFFLTKPLDKVKSLYVDLCVIYIIHKNKQIRKIIK